MTEFKFFGWTNPLTYQPTFVFFLLFLIVANEPEVSSIGLLYFRVEE